MTLYLIVPVDPTCRPPLVLYLVSPPSLTPTALLHAEIHPVTGGGGHAPKHAGADATAGRSSCAPRRRGPDPCPSSHEKPPPSRRPTSASPAPPPAARPQSRASRCSSASLACSVAMMRTHLICSCNEDELALSRIESLSN